MSAADVIIAIGDFESVAGSMKNYISQLEFFSIEFRGLILRLLLA